jgi:ribosomal protein S18 acetylase RimI-like enzyme
VSIDWAVELAENPNTYTPLGPDTERIVTDRYVLWMGRMRTWNVAQRFAMRDDEIDEVIEEVRAHLRERGRDSCAWEIGSHATPSDLPEQLLARGFADDQPEPLAIGMAMTEAPPPGPADVVVKVVETDDEYWESERVAQISFGEEVAAERKPFTPSALNPIYIALIDGKIVARASSAIGEHGVTLFGGATLPEARGRGAYRALVAARWRDAAERGTPLVVTQAGVMSRPILTRLGFREVGTVRALGDKFDA